MTGEAWSSFIRLTTKADCGDMNGNSHHVEENVEGIVLLRVGCDEADKSDEVESGRLDNDRSFFRKAEILAGVTNRVLAHPDAISDQHCM